MIHLLWASLAIPIVIHLVHRRKAKRVPFSTLRFLRMVDQRVARRQRLKELLLLALRLLLLAALIAALYRPMIRSATFKGSDVPTAVAVVLDNTYSLRASSRGAMRFGRARQAVADILDGLGKGDAAVLVPFDAQDEAPPELTTGLAHVRDELKAMECGYGTAELAGPLRRALAALERSTLPRKELYVVTDFQRLCWTPALAELQDAFPADMPVFLVDVGGEVQENLAVTSVEFGVNVQVAGAASQIYCRLLNTGSRNVEQNLGLFLNGEKVAEREVSLAAGAEATVVFSHVFGRSGQFAGELRLGPDELGPDDSRYFTVNVLESLPVLLVNGDPSTVPYLNETFFLELALSAPAAGGKTVSPVRAETVTAADFLEHRLDDYGCVILANVPRLPDLWAGRLRRYVEGGGGLIVFAGDRVDPASYNTALAGDGGESLLPALLGEVRRADEDATGGGFRIRRLDRQHPILRGVADAIDTGAARVERFFSVTPQAEGGAVLAELDAGPLLLEKKTGAGSVILCTSSADLDWNNLPARSFFLPVLHQMVYYAGRPATGDREVAVGSPYAAELPPSDEPVQVGFFGPAADGEDEPVELPGAGSTDEPGRAVLKETARPGVYRVVYTSGDEKHEELFAVNVETRESELDRIDSEEARRMVGARNARVVSDPDGLTMLVRREREGLPLWNHLFALAILLAVAESFVGNVLLKH